MMAKYCAPVVYRSKTTDAINTTAITTLAIAPVRAKSAAVVKRPTTMIHLRVAAGLPVFRASQSVRKPPAQKPAKPAIHGSDPPIAKLERSILYTSTRNVGNQERNT